jgi:hypothetical protein
MLNNGFAKCDLDGDLHRLFIFLLSTIGLAFVEGLFEHRVMLSYVNGTSRLWKGPSLIPMYSL